jgi:hypothetical protein
MKTAQEWYEIGLASKPPANREEEPKVIGDLIQRIQLDAFRSGMAYSASLKRDWHITEQEGVARLKTEIRELAMAINAIPQL